MDWPTLQYMKTNPDRVLLSTSKLTTLQMGAWSRIWFEMVKLPLPGVMVWTDLAKLHEWTGLPPSQWDKIQVRVLGKFRFHPATGSLHDAMIKDVYLDFTRQTLRMRAGAKASWNRRNARKISPSVSDQSNDISPYSMYRGDFAEITDGNWAEILEIIEKTRPIQGTLMPPLRVPQGTLCTTTINNKINSGDTTPALPSGEGAGVVQPPALVKTKSEKEKIDEFLATHTDAQLAEIQRRWEAQSDGLDYFRQTLLSKNPRTESRLAANLYTFAKAYPAPAASTTETPPAIAGESA